jgi:DNA-binding response OmpR family regulator
MARIYLIEDSDDLREATAVYLVRDGHEVTEFSSADAFLATETEECPDLYILDIMLPGRSGISLAHTIRARSDTAIIFVSAREDEMTKTAAFSAGADDYMVKPYSPRELALRVAAVLRRTAPDENRTPSGAGVLRFVSESQTMTVDGFSRRVLIDDREVPLTRTEWGILATLARGSGSVVSREQLLYQVFDYESGVQSRALDTHIKNLRRKLGAGRWVETVHGQGFRITTQGDS